MQIWRRAGLRFSLILSSQGIHNSFAWSPWAVGSLEAAEGLGVAETGGTGLRAVFDVGKTVLIADNDNARRWVLKRDWRPYGLFADEHLLGALWW